uniref:Uncharacterized protein n=2 Tax=Oryza sativa subsp. japonica TaxID=39947 RepID=A0A5S6R8B1_ORYSJ|nr:hypothetical protein [Oryza sativa Japonica Group]AAP55029.1 hypothetical protein LOC_Os10g41320 [Oryza sativa Japonica Group]
MAVEARRRRQKSKHDLNVHGRGEFLVGKHRQERLKKQSSRMFFSYENGIVLVSQGILERRTKTVQVLHGKVVYCLAML